MVILINHTNHPSAKWSDKQKEGFDGIIDLPFPNIPPDIYGSEVEQLVGDNLEKIKKIVEEHPQNIVGICLQGEFSYCYTMFKLLDIPVYIPTTERKVVEDGNTKTAVFEFVRWRVIPPPSDASLHYGL